MIGFSFSEAGLIACCIVENGLNYAKKDVSLLFLFIVLEKNMRVCCF